MATKASQITYNWDCNTVDIYPKNGNYTDVVYNVHYSVWGTDNSEPPIQANIIGTQILDIKNKVFEFNEQLKLADQLNEMQYRENIKKISEGYYIALLERAKNEYENKKSENKKSENKKSTTVLFYEDFNIICSVK